MGDDMDEEDVYVALREYNDDWAHMGRDDKQHYLLALKGMLQVRHSVVWQQ